MMGWGEGNIRAVEEPRPSKAGKRETAAAAHDSLLRRRE